MVVRRRVFDEAEQAELLLTLGHARKALVHAAERLPRRSVTRAGADRVVANIDELAFLLTGAREHFWEPQHATPGE
ncbi:hypothetical protein [Salinarimonas rosea]|uniref:hypothetical protein n=1 Tax=Salinarimonas rosea TaxID=552063 RepID=UPI0003FE220D|nr:hypothetical protein [Salinarimonas rosea]